MGAANLPPLSITYRIMKTEQITINGKPYARMVANEGEVFIRIHDKSNMGAEIVLSIDYSTGVPREDKPEYYEEIPIPEEFTEGREPIIEKLN